MCEVCVDNPAVSPPRCEDMVDVRRLKMLQMVQLFKCEEDASQVSSVRLPLSHCRGTFRGEALMLTCELFLYLSCVLFAQAVEWLGELLDALLKTHLRLGDDSQETKVLLEKHKKFVDVAQVQ